MGPFLDIQRGSASKTDAQFLPNVCLQLASGYSVTAGSRMIPVITRSDFWLAPQVSAWGGYVFIINLIPLHVFVLLLMQRYSSRVYIGEL